MNITAMPRQVSVLTAWALLVVLINNFHIHLKHAPCPWQKKHLHLIDNDIENESIMIRRSLSRAHRTESSRKVC